MVRRGEGRVGLSEPSSREETQMLWTILVIIVIILAVIGFFTVIRGRA